jgi:hypothetical protein
MRPDRGPRLIIGSEKDHTVPPTVTHASCKSQATNSGVTEGVVISNQGHLLTIASGRREVAEFPHLGPALHRVEVMLDHFAFNTLAS